MHLMRGSFIHRAVRGLFRRCPPSIPGAAFVLALAVPQSARASLCPDRILTALDGMGFDTRGFVLEPMSLSPAHAPEGAFDRVSAWYFRDTGFVPALDDISRDWTPVLVVGDQVMVGPSREFAAGFFRAVGAVKNSAGFTDPILRRIHDFSLDFTDGMRFSADSVHREPGVLFFYGRACSGTAMEPESHYFTTRITPDAPAAISLVPADPRLP